MPEPYRFGIFYSGWLEGQNLTTLNPDQNILLISLSIKAYQAYVYWLSFFLADLAFQVVLFSEVSGVVALASSPVNTANAFLVLVQPDEKIKTAKVLTKKI